MFKWLEFKLIKSATIEDIRQGEGEPPDLEEVFNDDDWHYTPEDIKRINEAHQEWAERGPTPVSEESKMRRQLMVTKLQGK